MSALLKALRSEIEFVQNASWRPNEREVAMEVLSGFEELYQTFITESVTEAEQLKQLLQVMKETEQLKTTTHTSTAGNGLQRIDT